MMDPVSVLPVFFSLLLALVLLYFLTKLFGKVAVPVKFSAIDGLRGYLAFFVFLHHASIYFFALRSYAWQLPPSQLYTHFGHTSVCLFFMITAFLFFTRLIEDHKKGIDWLKYFVSRILRLYPLLLIALALSFLFAGILSHFRLQEPGLQLLNEIGHWLLFTVFAQPNINAVSDTPSFMLSVLWSIKYEWLFYLFLPFVAFVFFRSKVSFITLFISLGIFSLIVYYSPPVANNLFVFSGGIFAAIAARSSFFCKLASLWLSSLLIIACLAVTVIFFESAREVLPLILVAISFTGIACGNSLFGILTYRLSRELGQLAYGIYLLHGLFLYALFHFVISDREQAVALSPLQFWLVVSALALVLVTVCFFLHYYIELPAIKSGQRATRFLRGGLNYFKDQVIKAGKLVRERSS